MIAPGRSIVLPDAGAGPPVSVALLEPEIPNNTGNIARTCVATGAALHLIHPLGFDTSEKACRRAGLDYWPRVNLSEHADLAAYRDAIAGARPWLFTTRGARSIYDIRFEPGDHMLFGRESRGLPAEVVDADPERAVAIPMVRGERSLNLATAVGIAIYEVLRQCSIHV